AAVCRDSGGNYLGSSALVVEGVDDPASLEAMACKEAMCLAEDLLLNNFVIASQASRLGYYNWQQGAMWCNCDRDQSPSYPFLMYFFL
uniref:RNase H type-1 domain-containing protein n=1 Tax=Aegilops tauschii subsp. strangulata TaxID=200361 RepID=A0A453LW71_AEGTS